MSNEAPSPAPLPMPAEAVEDRAEVLERFAGVAQAALHQITSPLNADETLDVLAAAIVGLLRSRVPAPQRSKALTMLNQRMGQVHEIFRNGDLEAMHSLSSSSRAAGRA